MTVLEQFGRLLFFMSGAVEADLSEAESYFRACFLRCVQHQRADPDVSALERLHMIGRVLAALQGNMLQFRISIKTIDCKSVEYLYH